MSRQVFACKPCVRKLRNISGPLSNLILLILMYKGIWEEIIKLNLETSNRFGLLTTFFVLYTIQIYATASALNCKFHLRFAQLA